MLFIHTVERNHCFVHGSEKESSATVYWRKSFCEPSVSHPGCSRKNGATGSLHLPFSLNTQVGLKESVITGPKNLWSHLFCQKIKPTRAKLPSPSTFKLEKLFCISLILYNAYMLDPILGTLKLDLPSYLNHSSFSLLLGLPSVSVLQPDTTLNRVKSL